MKPESKVSRFLQLVLIVTLFSGALSQRTRMEIRELINPDGSRAQGLQDYLDGVRCLMNKPSSVSGATEWDVMAKLHDDKGHLNHGYARFLPWHRLYVLGIEEAMTECLGRQVTVPYWNSAIDAALDGGAHTSPLYDHFGGRSGCVFNYTARYPSVHCLTRDYSPQTLATREQVQRFLRTSNFEDMVTGLEGFVHGTAHVQIGGDMGTMFSPNDPIFYMHHANVDRLWDQWQKLSESNSKTYSGYDPEYERQSSLNDVMSLDYANRYANSRKVKDLMNVENLGYQYSAGPTPIRDDDEEDVGDETIQESTYEQTTTEQTTAEQTTTGQESTYDQTTRDETTTAPAGEEPEYIVKRVKKELNEWKDRTIRPTWKKVKLHTLGYLPEKWIKMNHLNPEVLEKRREKVNRFTQWINGLEGFYPRHIDEHVVGFRPRTQKEGQAKEQKLDDAIRAYKLEKKEGVQSGMPMCAPESPDHIFVNVEAEDCAGSIKREIDTVAKIYEELLKVVIEKGIKIPTYEPCDDDDEERTTTPGDDDESTTTPGDDDESTTTPGDDDESTTTPGDDDESTTTPGDDDESTTTPGDGSTTTPGDNEETTTPGDDSTTTPGDGSTTTPGDNEETTTPGDDSTTTPGGDDSTTTPGDDSTTTPGGDDSTTTPGDDDEETTTPGDDDEETTTPGEEEVEWTTTPTQQDRNDEEEESSSAGPGLYASNAGLIAGVVVGAAVAAGIAAVAIGLMVNASAATGAGAASGAPMAAANTNPLYTPFTSEGVNAGFGN